MTSNLTKEDFDHIHKIFLWSTDHVEEWIEDGSITDVEHRLVWDKVLQNANKK